jgi:hypothetical protein
MKRSLFSEERRAARSGRPLVMLFAVFWLGISVLAGCLVYSYSTKANLTPLQRVYLPEYWKSIRRSWLPYKAQSGYRLLERSFIDPKTNKENSRICSEQELDFVLDEDGGVHYTQNKLPDIHLKPEYAAETKSFYLNRFVREDKVMYGWLRQYFYDGQGALDLLSPSFIAGAILFFPGLIGAGIFKRRLTRRHLRGQHSRGTRELTPKEYERLHRRDTGIGLEVSPYEGGN